MSALRELIATFGIEVEDQQLKEADKGIEEFTKKLQTVGRILVGGAAAVGLFEFAKNLSEIGHGLETASVKLGISTDSLQALGFAAEQSGAGIEGLTTGLLMLQDKVGDALINATGEGAKAFQKYGIHIKDAAGNVKSADEIMGDVADRMGKAKSEAEKVTIAVDLFGRQGRALIPLLKEGAGGIEELKKQFAELGGGYTKEAIESSKQFHDALGRFGVVTLSLKGRIATVLLPALQWIVDKVTKASSAFLEFTKNTSIIQATLAVLGGALAVLAIQGAAAMAPFIAFAGAIGVLVLLVDDLITMFRGGKSVIGEFIDQLFGVGAANKVVAETAKVWGDLSGYIKEAYETVKKIVGMLGDAGGAIGDDAAQIANKVQEWTGTGAFANADKGRGGLTYMQNVAKRNAKRKMDADAAGTPYVPDEIPAGISRADFSKGVDEWVERMKADRPNESVVGRSSGTNVGPTTVSTTININGAQDPQAVGDEVRRVLDEHNRSAYDAVVKHSEQ